MTRLCQAVTRVCQWVINRVALFDKQVGINTIKLRVNCSNHLSQPLLDDSSGKSGANFYQSYDKLFIIKTLTSEEVERMHSFLKHYHPYIVERHGKTLLPQYLGMYRLTVDGMEHYVVSMRNVFSNHLTTHKKFDLKGSTVDREASDKEKEKELPTFKDNDFVKEKMKIYIGDEAKTKLINTLSADVEFFNSPASHGLSLLLGVHNCARAEQENKEQVDKGDEDDQDDDERHRTWGWSGASGMATPPESPQGVVTRDASLQDEDSIIPELEHLCAPEKEIYFLAIIDVLTHYVMLKVYLLVDPEQYGKRFIEFLSRAIE
ncbi:unnamed protein product [Trichogramma brassicae]|uniref:PIPK domain-containing protein n=1 Tax=Trichogramma brassicae TaxID=86971 RepID=A0A6H5HXJ4_9HYME|nr:unnamed protein product [Trichogramma brassicae]